MKILYLECLNGAAGDMIMAALLELLPVSKQKAFIKKINSIGLAGVKVILERVNKSGIAGSKIHVKIYGKEEGQSSHRGHKSRNLQDINKIVSKLKLSLPIRKNILGIYNSLADAEAKVHGVRPKQIHFHEIGNLDAIADIAGVCVLMEMIASDKIIASPVNVGGGFVKCAHGMLPVPAPATAELLKGIPVFSGKIKEELCTPTGAAIIKYFAKNFGPMPAMALRKTGYGFGHKEFETLNCVRAFLGDFVPSIKDKVVQLECNLDDATGEEAGFACDILFKNGALDVFILPVFMKKNRPGFWMFCLCKENEAEKFAKLILKHTPTLGVRKTVYDRFVLERKLSAVQTHYGKILTKEAEGFGIKKSKLEYEDIARVARKDGTSLAEIKRKIRKS